jgi:Fe-S-cluster containining protein
MGPSAEDAAYARHLQGLAEFAWRFADMAYAGVTTPEKSHKLIRKLDMVAETETRKIERHIESLPPEERATRSIDCKMGCCFCCSQPVATTVPEVLALAAFIEEQFTENDQQALLERIQLYKAALEQVPAGVHPMVPCPLLVNNLCSAHPARPLTCRGYNSLDVTLCVERFEHPEKDVPIRISKAQKAVAEALGQGYRSAMNARNLDPSYVMLGPALEIALTEEDAAERFFAGDDLFSAAKMQPS